MSDLIQIQSTNPTMSSREIAELCEKQHAHVMRDIRAMLDGLEISPSRFGSTYFDTQGKERDCFKLPKDLTITLVAGYNVKLRKRIIDRWLELEGQQNKPIDYSDPRVIIGVIETQSKRIEALTSEVEEAKPKVKALDRIATADGSLCITDAAKALQMRPKDLFAFLQSEKWIYRRTGGSGYLGYQTKVQQGLLEHKVTTVQNAIGERVVEQVRVLPKGLSKLATLIVAEVLL